MVQDYQECGMGSVDYPAALHPLSSRDHRSKGANPYVLNALAHDTEQRTSISTDHTQAGSA